MLHKHGNLVSLEQRRVKQLLTIIYKSSWNENNIVILAGNTRPHKKQLFRVEKKSGNKICKKPVL